MNYALTTIAQPESEPITLAHAKAHLKIDHDAEDELITGWIGAARELTEAYTGKRWITQRLRLTLREFPEGPIEIPVQPVSSIDLLKYLDAVGVERTILGADYQTWLDHNPPLVAPPPEECWPDTEFDKLKTVTVEFTAGAGTVPKMVESAILLTLGLWDENRGDQSVLNANGLPPGAKRLLDLLWNGAYR